MIREKKYIYILMLIIVYYSPTFRGIYIYIHIYNIQLGYNYLIQHKFLRTIIIGNV